MCKRNYEAGFTGNLVENFIVETLWGCNKSQECFEIRMYYDLWSCCNKVIIKSKIGFLLSSSLSPFPLALSLSLTFRLFTEWNFSLLLLWFSLEIMLFVINLVGLTSWLLLYLFSLLNWTEWKSTVARVAFCFCFVLDEYFCYETFKFGIDCFHNK